ncbi:MAG: hypothetical protein IPI42_13070 [Saprospiraceae bacterium]|nr:hypothetical protein [Candidatus Parvibacillus calidus]
MKKLFGFWNLMLLVGASLFVVSCNPDDNPTSSKGPTVTETHTFDATKDQDPLLPIIITVKGVKGDADLKSLTVKENGTNLDVDRFLVDDNDPSSAAILLLGADKQGFTKVFEIDPVAKTGAYKYEFVLTDEKNNTNTVALEVNIKTVATITSEKMYNYLGPLAGGLDLLTGKAVVKGADVNNEWATAHIRDNGNDVVGNTYPWKGEFIPWKGSVVRKTDNSNWDLTVSPVQISSLFDNGLTDLATVKMKVGDVYVVKNGDHYFMIKVKEVSDDGSASKNEDFSSFEIKQ